MARVNGLIYEKGEFIEGHVEFEEGLFRSGEGFKDDPVATGIVIPKFINCHVHLGDAFIPKPDRGSVEELVAPPDGLKHRMLKQVSEEEQTAAMRNAMTLMANSGTSHFMDFREGGTEGARHLFKAAMGMNIRPVIFGRPAAEKFDEEEMDSLLAAVDGIGVSAMTDWDYEELRAVSDRARSAGKPFALHASEVVREDIDTILDLKPAFLVHMIQATGSDLETCATGDVPVVICPTANSFFGMRPPLMEMVEAGVRVCLGTDNAMFAPPDMFREIKTLRTLVSEESLSDARLFELIFDNCGKTLNSILGLGGEVGKYRECLVLNKPLEDPHRQVLEASAEDIIPLNHD